MSDLTRRLVRAARLGARAILLSLVRTLPVRRGAARLVRSHYRRGLKVSASIDRVVSLAAPTAQERLDSVDSLVELFFDVVQLARVSTFVEAGAKEATASKRAVSCGISTAIAFEANPYTYRRFARRLESAGVDYRHAALLDRPGEIAFVVRVDERGSPRADGRGSVLAPSGGLSDHEHVTVPATSLDEAIVGSGPVALWVDVEGAVAEVFAGGSHLLGRAEAIIVEVESHPRWAGQRWLAGDVKRFMAQHGLTAVARDMQARSQFNIVFVPTDLLSDPALTEALSNWARPRRLRRS